MYAEVSTQSLSVISVSAIGSSEAVCPQLHNYHVYMKYIWGEIVMFGSSI